MKGRNAVEDRQAREICLARKAAGRGNLLGMPVAANKPEAHRTQRACAAPAPGFTANTRPRERHLSSQDGALAQARPPQDSVPARIRPCRMPGRLARRRGRTHLYIEPLAIGMNPQQESASTRLVREPVEFTTKPALLEARTASMHRLAQCGGLSVCAPHLRRAMPGSAGSARWNPEVPTRAAHLPRASRR